MKTLGGEKSSPGIQLGDDEDTGFFSTQFSNDIAFSASGTQKFNFNTNGIVMQDGQILLTDGTEASPSLSFTNDTDTGIRRQGDDNLAVVANGTDGLVIQNDGSSTDVTAPNGFLAADTIKNASSDFRLAIGPSAGNGNLGETAIGAEAAQNNTGNQSVAVGFEALGENTGAQSTAVGTQAGRRNNAFGLTALGVSAASYSGVSPDNIPDDVTAVGQQAGQNGEGSDSVLIGTDAGNEQEGDSTTAIGVRAAETNTGVDTVAVGRGAANNNDGDGLIALGRDAGDENSTDDVLLATDQNGNKGFEVDLAAGDVKPVNNVDFGKGKALNVGKETRSVSSNTTTSGERTIFVDTSPKPQAITLSSADTFEGKEITVVDSAGNAGTNQITVDTENGNATINGELDAVIDSNFEALTFQCDGTNFFITSRMPGGSVQ